MQLIQRAWLRNVSAVCGAPRRSECSWCLRSVNDIFVNSLLTHVRYTACQKSSCAEGWSRLTQPSPALPVRVPYRGTRLLCRATASWNKGSVCARSTSENLFVFVGTASSAPEEQSLCVMCLHGTLVVQKLWILEFMLLILFCSSKWRHHWHPPVSDYCALAASTGLPPSYVPGALSLIDVSA